MRSKFLWLAVFLWLGLALRLFHLGYQSLWYDEGVTWYLTQFSLPDLVRWTAADIQPPLYYLLMWGAVRLLGSSEFALRFPSVVAGMVSLPLLGLFLRRRTAPWSEIAVVAMTAIAPLAVYYSQEARMYTLLVLESVLSSYFVLRVANQFNRQKSFLPNPPAIIFVVAYIPVMAAALYTHYFAAFLLATHAIYLLGRLVFSEYHALRPVWLKVGLMLGGPTVIFLPWLSVMLARLGDDPSYWSGALKLNEVLLDVLISFTVGGKREMILETHAVPLAIGFAGLLIVCFAAWWITALPSTRLTMILLGLWLIIPVAAILLLSYRIPKFNPRYTILAWSPWVLLMAGGLPAIPAVLPKTLPLKRIILPAIVLFIVLSWSFSLTNWFFDPRFSKTDFKHTAQFIRERFTPGDTVLLNSGHFFPVWQYYAGNDNFTPLPVMKTLDVNRVTGFEIIPALKTALIGRSGVWLVRWQDEVIDPNGVIPLLLDATAVRLADEFHAANFWGVKLDYWQLPPSPTFPTDFPATVRTEANFGNLVTLRGLWQSPTDDHTVALMWQATGPLTDDYQVSLRLLDAAGVPWSRETRVARPAAYLYPTQRWLPGQVIAGWQPLLWLTGTPPGDYWLEVGWLTSTGDGVDLLDAGGNPQRRTALIGPVRVYAPIPGDVPGAALPLAETDGLQLLSAAFDPPEAEAGSRVLLDALWQVSGPALITNSLVFAAWRDSAGNVFAPDPPITIAAAYPTGTVFRSRTQLTTPYQAEPGLVSLMVNENQSLAIDKLTLRSTSRVFVPPDHLQIAANANFAGLTILLGANTDSTRRQAGQSVQVTLYWQAQSPLPADYAVFVHLLGTDGVPLLNADHAPPRPTTNWIAGEIIADPVTFTLPLDLPPGVYPLEVGLYNPTDPAFARLLLADSGATYLILSRIEVIP